MPFSKMRAKGQLTPVSRASCVVLFSFSLISFDVDSCNSSLISLSDRPACFAACEERHEVTLWHNKKQMVQRHLLSATRLDKLVPQTVMQVVWCLCLHSRSFSTAPGTPAPPVCLHSFPSLALLPQSASQTRNLGNAWEEKTQWNHCTEPQLCCTKPDHPATYCTSQQFEWLCFDLGLYTTINTREDAQGHGAAIINIFILKTAQCPSA